MIDIKVPPVGESITEGVIAEWVKQEGEYVEEGDELFELETDKVTMAVPAEASGKITIKAEAGIKVEIGQVVGQIDPDAQPDESAEQTEKEEPEVPQTEGAEISAPAGKRQMEEKLSEEKGYDYSEYSPSVRKILTEHNLDPQQITPTGKGGRLTKEDVVNFLDSDESRKPPKPEPKKEDWQKAQELPPMSSEKKEPQTAADRTERQTRKKMSALRARIAERLVIAQQNAAILTTFNEVDMTNLMEMRAKYKESFQKKYDIKLGIMSFFIKASVEALKSVPEVNAQIDGDEIVYNHFYDIGVAVSTEKGLVVPVVRDADKLSFAEIEMQLADFGERAQKRTLTLDELTGGVFTVSNGGIFGSMLSTPILNPPQSAILGMHGIKKRPMAAGEDDRIEVRPMMYLAVSYDHRLIDGREAVTFLRRIVECIEDPERLMLEV